jgi:hypothetical protein
MHHTKAAATVALSILATSANAGFIQINPADYPEMTNLTHIVEGVTLEAWRARGGDPSDGWEPPQKFDIYGKLCSPCMPSTNGQMVFSYENPYSGDMDVTFESNKVVYSINKEPSYPYYTTGVVATIDEGTNFIEMVGGGGSYSDYFMMDLWDTAGNYIGKCSTQEGSNSAGCLRVPAGSGVNDPYARDQWTFIWFSESIKIGLISMGGMRGGQYVQSLRVNVPEPATIALVGIPVLAMAAVRRRRRPQAV